MRTNPSCFTEIPVIDIASLLDPDASRAARVHAAEEIGDACRHVGFFYIKNHGIPEDHRTRMFEASRRFFSLPREEKMKLYIGDTPDYRGYIPLGGEVTRRQKDWHESLDFHHPGDAHGAGDWTGAALIAANRWPDRLPGFQEVMSATWDRMIALGARVTRGLALSLGLDETFFEPYTRRPICTLRLSHYPPYTAADDLEDVGEGIGEHCDYGFLTILAQDDVGGLEVKNAADEWVPAPYIPGAFVVNIGQMTQRWTNDRYGATRHRVRIPGHRGRYSIPFFYEPDYDTVVEPLPVCCDAEHPPRYAPCHFGKFVEKKFSVSYAAHYETT